MYINENRFFSMLESFFQEPSNVLHELIQNSSRARATEVKLYLKGGILTATDNGKGCDNWKAIFVLATSGWNENIQKNQQPAGFGIYHLMAVSETLFIKSEFGSVEIETDKFFTDETYRDNLSKLINETDKAEGFEIQARLKEKVLSNIKFSLIDTSKSNFGYYDIDVLVNDVLIDKNRSSYFLGEDSIKIEATYMKNKITIALDKHYFSDKREKHIYSLIDFYGLPIYSGFMTSAIKVYYKLRNGLPINPVLPYRHAMKKDKQLDQFDNFIKRTIVEFAINKINIEEPPKNELLMYMQLVEQFGEQQDLNRLNRFYYSKKQPYYRESFYAYEVIEKIIYSKKDLLTFTTLEIYIDNNTSNSYIPIDYNKLTLEDGAYWEICDIDRFPDWTQKEYKTIEVEFEVELEYSGEYNWYKGKSNNPNFRFISFINQVEEGSIIYTTDNHKIALELAEPIFSLLYYEDRDYDDGKTNFERTINEDIQKMSNTYDVDNVLESLNIIEDMNVLALKTLSIEDKALSFILTNGFQKTVNLS